MLTDHGEKLHGWSRQDYDSMHNHGRSSILFEFRNFMIANVLQGVDSSLTNLDKIGHRKRPKGPPYLVTISIGSSTGRVMANQGHKSELERAYGDKIRTKVVFNSMLSIEEQIAIASSTSIYISICGGGAVTAMFLPEGSSVVMYYREDGGIEKGKNTNEPALLDWDIWNNMAWIRTHWMPARQMNLPVQVNALIKLVGHELDIMADEDSS